MSTRSSKNGTGDLKNNSNVSFSRSKGEGSCEFGSNDDEIQFSLASFMPTYLRQGGHEFRCCGICLPVPFERAARNSWWDPRFDSGILEGQFWQSAFPQIRLRFRYSLVYLMIMSISWSCYLLTYGAVKKENEALPLGIIYGLFAIFCLFILWVTRSPSYRRYQVPVGVITAVGVCLLSLASVASSPVLTPAGDFAIAAEILVLLYTVVPLPLYLCVFIGALYSTVFECLGTGFASPVRILSHICIHLISLHIFIMTSVRMRGTFMKIGQSLLVRKQLEMEKQLKEKMIDSVMPPKVANWLMSEGRDDGVRNPSGADINSLFRPFNMSSMKDVSILFADIVGFTRMSSNKTASQLVAILNELFARFDYLCQKNECEKISTLGDCYYCVSGCPEPRPDHAICCVQMGLGMIEAIREFDEEFHEDVNMRVGVHTGAVLCGVVGRKRFKFDVWSNDVTFANKMESTGKPGRVHISQPTKNFLAEQYVLEPGDPVNGVETYFIVESKEKLSNTTSSQPVTVTPPSDESTLMGYETALPLTESATESMTTAQDVNTPLAESVHLDNMLSTSLFERCESMQETPGIPQLIFLKERLSDKATSLPSVFSRDSQIKTFSHTSLSKSYACKYSPLNLDISDTENEILHPNCNNLSPKTVDNYLQVPKEDLSLCQSASRKDSGIKSTSRRSSIQQQLYVMNGLTHKDSLNHRVSGYYTSSRSSLNLDVEKDSGLLSPPLVDAICFQKLRKQSDIQLIKCVQASCKSEPTYFVTRELKPISLKFKDEELEYEYRQRSHVTPQDDDNRIKTLATARFNTYFDITIAFIVFVCITVSSFIILPISWDWIPVFIVLTLIQLSVIIVCLKSVIDSSIVPKLEEMLTWYPWQATGAVIVSLPMLAVLTNFRHLFTSTDSLFNYCYLFYISMVHYCNFTQLNCWMKSSLATAGAIIYLVLVTSTLVNIPVVSNITLNQNYSDNITSVMPTQRITTTLLPTENLENIVSRLPDPDEFYYDENIDDVSRTKRDINMTVDDDDEELKSNVTTYKSLPMDSYPIENLLNVFLMLVMVWFLNREFEISYRLSFHGNAVAAKDKARVQSMRDQADILLHNIIPKHVVDQLKNTARYSEDVKDAGIIFASIVNFSGMYDESYLDGKECLRVLNELISDFDELLSEERFSMVEKIKTIGTTYMAASGLNICQRQGMGYQHLYQLMEFALALQASLDNFNAHLLEYSLVLRVGFNFGDVTAGVVGTDKLFYDIWGDAVNIASRMDSTGIAGKIQVPTSTTPILSKWYKFQPRGTVFVKGKDNMEVSFLESALDTAQN